MQNNYYKVKCDNYGKPICLTICYDHHGSLDYLIFRYLECVKIQIHGRRRINLLPRQLEVLSVDEMLDIYTVPKTLLEIIMRECSYKVDILLPKNLHLIGASFDAKCGFELLPKYLHYVSIGSPSTNITLPKSLKYMFKYNNSVANINLPKNLKKLNTGYYFNQFIELLKGFKCLVVDYAFNQRLMLPKYMVRLSTGSRFDQNIVLPETIVELRFTANAKLSMTDNLPNGLRSLKLPCYSTFDKHPYSYFTNNLPNGVKKVR